MFGCAEWYEVVDGGMEYGGVWRGICATFGKLPNPEISIDKPRAAFQHIKTSHCRDPLRFDASLVIGSED